MSNKNITAKSMKILQYEKQVSGGWDGTSNFWNKQNKPKKVKRGGKMKEGMTAFIRDLVLMWRSANVNFNAEYHIDHGHSYDLANVIVRNMQFFDC